ncbi:flagellar export chaperone FlgN [Chromobacterium subtsugae]|uniref:Flagellar export chaperone FlgN n=1 Tax=Chromobacterium subtsugae TaxID=251747 RepID=A0ABS7FBN6_9NEIS|nr:MULTISPECIES: flagellar export chaperone FlgN [Chromobacterium]KUM02996.1 hypothetical protein Cv017_21555 [Chromobacterium subtsugae]KZE85955.1 hypothetical protein AWB61_18110 [Chromobacterium sp. F49]MBW7567328.1 flagellar export chaperone FlgN [Chromobacterium subtsugae]MBW8287494.1 flagellar export chaperone FlgN [Chromobacterium subtsugae]OBU84844.1 hypothetical protein MY55_20100 [Chromobacterium subtsugae]
MDRQQDLRRLFATVADDLAAYPLLQACLERQFAAALAHDAQALSVCADEIGALCRRLELSRRERLGAAERLLPAGAELTMAAVLRALPERQREQGERHWLRLRGMVADCRELNLRNGQLLQQRRLLLQRVLEGESDVYAAQ